MRTFLAVALVFLAGNFVEGGNDRVPVRLAIAGLVHDRVNSFIVSLRGRPEVELTGIVESNTELAADCFRRLGLPQNILYTNFDELFARTNVDAVVAFTSTFDHRQVVEECAAHGVDVMVEKPLAVNMEHARAMAAAARAGGIRVLVNYQTTWYPANQSAYEIVHDQHAIGEVRKIIAHDGHRGPKEIGCSPVFLAWLTDPVLNGGGALTDFGCYGADLATWLMDGRRPTAVFAVTQQIKPEVYPKVEDEATLVLTYPHAQAIVEASWNGPFERMDLEIYGKKGYVLAPQADLVRVRKTGGDESQIKLEAPPSGGALTDEISYLAAVVRKEVEPAGPSSLELNLTVTEILDAARESARTGRRIDLPAAAP